MTVEREASTRARLVRELLDTPAVQELIRARLHEDSPRVGALEAAVRQDPELAMGVAVHAVGWVNEALYTVVALAELLAGMPAPFVREVLDEAWSRLDRDVVRRAWSSFGALASSEVVDRDAVSAWLSSKARAAVRSSFEAYDRLLRRDPRALERVLGDVLDGVEPAVVERTADATLDQLASVMASRPYLLRSLGRFVLRVAGGSVRATLRR